MEQLPEDIILEILVRVTGIPDLFRCAVTCTRWRLLIANHSFLRRRWLEGARHQSTLLGFFSEPPAHEERITAGIIPTPMPLFTPAPWSPFGHRCRFPNIPEPRGYRTVPLTSRRSLLLVRFVPYSLPLYEIHVNLGVCDPLARKSRVLALLKIGLSRILGCTILTRADCQRCPVSPSVCPSAFFKVLIVTYVDGQYILHVFTSVDSSWSTPIKFFDSLEHDTIIWPLQFNATVCQGMAYWLYRDISSHYILSVSTKTSRVSMTKIAIAPDQPGFNFYSAPLLSVTDVGALAVLRLYKKCTGVEIWTCQDGNENVDECWRVSKLVRLKRPKGSKIHLVQGVCMGEMSGTLLIKDNKNCMYIIADLEAGTMETVTELFRGVDMRFIPFEMDWPAFFMSRLAGGTIKQTKLEGDISKVANSFWGRLFGQLSLS